jgi:hypothetical protein
MVRKKIRLREGMTGLQMQMDAKLTLSRRTLTHPVAIGDVAELEWIGLLSEYLPRRYSVDRGFVVDHTGSVSDQIDILVYDKHYTPFVFHINGVKYIPAEAIYAAIECKQDINKKNIAYAAKKAKSVRLLKRTSLEITHAGGTHPAKTPHNVLFCLVCVGGNLSKANAACLEKLSAIECLNAVCSLSGTYARINGFQLWKKNKPPFDVTAETTSLSLVMFVLNLIADLQAIGTVTAIDTRKYLSSV